MGRMSGKVVVVTGAAQGIGRTYAESLAAEGAKVVVTDIQDTDEAVAAIKAAGGEAIGLQTDVTSDESLAAMVEEAESTFGPIEVLINNASIFATLTLKPFTKITNDEWDAVMRVNVRGPFQATKAVLPSMKKNGRGKIINISSGTALRGAPMFPHYVSSKGAIIAQTRAMSRELADDNIHVNTIIVGLTESKGVKEHEQLGAIKAPTLAMRAIKREMLPEDLVGTMLFLATEDSDFITGQSVNVDGGALNQ
ncbi:MAG: SDR family oxidoreductase [Woeseia sp.]|nr:SDR family oxidoreductase [Woeseia sp.]NNE60949.1 SDR family oxidoreductase [Woeseia sp.]NNL53975.1 SDR family oxidoreductase [Woeseia sp.]